MPDAHDKPDTTALRDKVAAQAQIFSQQQPLFAEFARILEATLKAATASLPGHPMVNSRVKQLGSFVEKCIRKDRKYHSPAWQLTDLCAARVIVLGLDAIPAVRRMVEDLFLVLEQEDAGRRLGETGFGYSSVHYVVALDPAKIDRYRQALGGAAIDQQLLASRTEVQARANNLAPGPLFRAEIQIRTLLQHAWAGAVHDQLYKTDLKATPEHLIRQSARISAMLEEADQAIASLVAGVEEYHSAHGAYLTPAEIEHQLQVQRLILDYQPDNRAAILEFARLAASLGDNAALTAAEQFLTRLEQRQDAAAHHQLGVIRGRLGLATGKSNLEQAAALEPDNADTWCELAKTYLPTKDYGKALPHYHRALEANPESPRTLLRLIECEILYGKNNPLSALTLLKSNLERAIAVSRKRISAGMHLPHAWYDTGFFHLLLRRPHASLEAYGKALLHTASAGLAIQVYQSLTRIHEMVYDKDAALDQALTLVRAFLRVVLVGRFGQDAETYLHGGEPHLDGATSLAPSHRDNSANPFASPGPVVIVAGSCSAASQAIIDGYAPLMHEVLSGLQGTLCSGGTASGVSGIVGEVADAGGALRKIGYLPKEGQAMPGYTCIRTVPGTFSPLDPLMLWADYLAAGRDPQEVRILCLRGGEIAACECMMGLLLGSRVAVLPESGGASQRLAKDPDWQKVIARDSSGRSLLLRLPADVETLRAFLRPASAPQWIEPTTREKIAADIHESYCRDARQNLFAIHANLAPWEKLSPTFKKANLGLIDHIEAKLQRLGLALQKAEGSQARPFTFSPAQLETLAEMEHGRWVVERLEDGWTLGERNDARKTRPQLIPWAGLPQEEKEKDYAAVRRLPELLAAEGYVIVEARDTRPQGS